MHLKGVSPETLTAPGDLSLRSWHSLAASCNPHSSLQTRPAQPLGAPAPLLSSLNPCRPWRDTEPAPFLPNTLGPSTQEETGQWSNRKRGERQFLVRPGGQDPSFHCDVISLPAASAGLSPRGRGQTPSWLGTNQPEDLLTLLHGDAAGTSLTPLGHRESPSLPLPESEWAHQCRLPLLAQAQCPKPSRASVRSWLQDPTSGPGQGPSHLCA